MAPPVYSVRFCLAFAPMSWAQFTVASGHRAVVKSVVLSNAKSDSTHFCVVRVANHQLLLRYPAADATEAYAMTQVAYPGETIEAVTDSDAMAVFVSGFYFVDGAGAEAIRDQEELGTYEDWVTATGRLG